MTTNYAGIPNGNNVVLVSYELMNKLGQTYIQMLYKSFGIESDHAPEVRDGNEKYVKKHQSLQRYEQGQRAHNVRATRQ